MDNTSPGPFHTALAITPHDTTNIKSKWATRGVYVGGAGDVTAVVNGAAILFKSVPVGTILPINATRVNATGTTATYLVALF